jgi:hypothetical protein
MNRLEKKEASFYQQEELERIRDGKGESTEQLIRRSNRIAQGTLPRAAPTKATTSTRNLLSPFLIQVLFGSSDCFDRKDWDLYDIENVNEDNTKLVTGQVTLHWRVNR